MRTSVPWSLSEDIRMREEFAHVTTAEMAARLGRTLYAVAHRAGLLGLVLVAICAVRQACVGRGLGVQRLPQ